LGKKGVIRTAKGNWEGFLQVLQHMLIGLCGYTILLYVDGANGIKGKKSGFFFRNIARFT